MSFVTLEDFFNNYRIKNQQQPNETVLNRGLMRLKRETRELKSVTDILFGNPLNEWSANKIYEEDEYVSHNDLIFKSVADRNYGNEPSHLSTTWWELVTISNGSGAGSKLDYYKIEATSGQTTIITPFSMNSKPMVFVDGLLLDESRYTVISNTRIDLVTPATLGEVITVSSGVTYDSTLVVAKQNFTATNNQYIFTTDFIIKNPSVFVNGQLLNETQYTWSNTSVTLAVPVSTGTHVTIGNGSVLGAEIYTIADIDGLLTDKRDISDSYSKTEVNTLLNAKATTTYVDTQTGVLSSAKADKATTLAGYGITNAYTKTEVTSFLSSKLDSSLYADAVVLQKIKNVDGAGSGLDADLLDGLDSSIFVRKDIVDGKLFNLSIASVVDPNAQVVELVNEILLDTDSVEPNIFIRKYNNNVITDQATVYTDKNTSHVMIQRDGYFKGTWEPTLSGTFGIADYNNYNWSLIVTPVLTGFEHDYNADFASGHTPFTGFDNNITWDSNQSEYHYGYVEGNILKMKAFHKNDSQIIDIPARYHLIGVLKSFSSSARVNQS